jgi:hypothetical protein
MLSSTARSVEVRRQHSTTPHEPSGVDGVPGFQEELLFFGDEFLVVSVFSASRVSPTASSRGGFQPSVRARRGVV